MRNIKSQTTILNRKMCVKTCIEIFKQCAVCIYSCTCMHANWSIHRDMTALFCRHPAHWAARSTFPSKRIYTIYLCFHVITRIVFVIIHDISLDTYFLLLKIANAFVLDTLSKNLELRHKLQRIVISSQNLRYYFDHQYFNRSICDLNLFIYLEN